MNRNDSVKHFWHERRLDRFGENMRDYFVLDRPVKAIVSVNKNK